MIFVIEHLEPKMYEWCELEYKHISSIVGAKNLWITNCKSRKLSRYAKIISKSVKKLSLHNICVLDPEAPQELKPREKFEYFVFGGILGNNPPKERTKTELTKFLPNVIVRNLGKQQMATDNAVYAAKEIIRGKKLSELKFTENLEINIRKGESVVLPYKYILVKGKPLISEELVKMMKKQKGF